VLLHSARRESVRDAHLRPRRERPTGTRLQHGICCAKRSCHGSSPSSTAPPSGGFGPFRQLRWLPRVLRRSGKGWPFKMLMSFSVRAESTPLVVHDLGDFEASFVPCLDDFERLDRRFCIPRSVWDELPVYQDYGFAVFKLKASAGRGLWGFGRGSQKAATRKVHPMAFDSSPPPRAAVLPDCPHSRPDRPSGRALRPHALLPTRARLGSRSPSPRLDADSWSGAGSLGHHQD
jgi:hypothetical protein